MSTKVDFKYKNGNNIYFTSDTHFCHTNIIKFCDRPFSTIKEMDEKLIENWNNKVPEDGIVFHLGDFAWGRFKDWENVRNRLNGNIILIKGNHDLKNGPETKTQEDKLFDGVYQQLYISIENRKIYLNHYPFLCYGGTYRNENDLVFQLFGHVHSYDKAKGKDIERLSMLFPTQYDVGVDNNNLTPISWNEVNDIIINQIKERKQNEKIKNY